MPEQRKSLIRRQIPWSSTLELALLAAVQPAAIAAQQTERFEITGERIAVYNLAGDVTVEAGSGSAETLPPTAP